MQDVTSNRFFLEYWNPAPPLAAYISGYHRYHIGLKAGERFNDVFFPGWTNIRFVVGADPWSVRFGRRSFFPGQASLFGATSHAGYVDAGSGTLIGIGITPIGWGRLFCRGADEFADKVAPLDRLLGTEAATLNTALVEGRHPPDLFDGWLLDRLERSSPETERIGEIFTLIADPQIATVASLVERTAMPERQLTRLTRRHFGFAPKLLLRRSRFLRGLMAIQKLERGGWARAAATAGYHDQSHFLRDCHLFLDMSLGEFVRLPKPMAEISQQLRTQSLGAPIQALHALSRDQESGIQSPE